MAAPRRLDAESIRDAALSGERSLTARSAAAPVPEPDHLELHQHDPFKAVYDTNRRERHLMTQRINGTRSWPVRGPDTNASTAARTTSTTALAGAYLMNDPFVHDQARRFAARLLAGKKTTAAASKKAYPSPVAARCGREKTAARLPRKAATMKASGVPPDQLPRRAWESLFGRCLSAMNLCMWISRVGQSFEAHRELDRQRWASKTRPTYEGNHDVLVPSTRRGVLRSSSAARSCYRRSFPNCSPRTAGTSPVARRPTTLARKPPHFPAKAKRHLPVQHRRVAHGHVRHTSQSWFAADGKALERRRRAVGPETAAAQTAVGVQARRQVRHARQRSVPTFATGWTTSV